MKSSSMPSRKSGGVSRRETGQVVQVVVQRTGSDARRFLDLCDDECRGT